MRTILKYILLLSFTFSISQATWINKWERVEIDGRYSGEAYLDVYFLPENPDHGWICGFNSQVSFTTDGGESWETVRASQFDIQLESIHFVSTDIGYTSGSVSDPANVSGKIFKSTDGGRSWQDITPSTLNKSMWGNYFYDENNGFVVGNDPGCEGQSFFKTTDGGNSWDLTYYDNPFGGKLSDVRVYPENDTGYAVSSGNLWITTNLGESWEIEFSTGGYDWQEELTHIGESFLFPYNEGCSGDFGGRGGLRFTTNYGESFNNLNLPSGYSMYGTFLLDETTGWGCGFERSMYYTCNGGVDWENLNCGITGNLDDVYFIDDTTGWVVGDYVFKTMNVTEANKVVSRDTIWTCPGEEVDLEPSNSNETFPNYRWSNCRSDRAITTDEKGKHTLYGYADPCDTVKIFEFYVMEYEPPSPEISLSSGNNSLCVGDTTNLTVDKEYVSYQWNTGDTSNNIEVTESGNYSVTVVDTNGCEITEEIEVVFNPLPEPEIQLIGEESFCIGDSAVLSSVKEHSSYKWVKEENEGEIHSTEREFKVDEEGNYFLIAENEFGCVDTSESRFIEVRIDSNRLAFEYSQEVRIKFDTTELDNKICRDITIHNTSVNEELLRNIYIEDKFYFSYPGSQLPQKIPPNDSIKIEICFYGDSVGYFEDRLRIEDNCSPHRTILEAYAESFELNGATICEIPWTYEARRLADSYFFENSLPYPNPSGGLLSIDFVEYTPNDEKDINVQIYNSRGELISELQRKVNKFEKPDSNSTLEYGEYYNEVPLSSGLYFVIIKKDGKTVSHPILINK